MKYYLKQVIVPLNRRNFSLVFFLFFAYFLIYPYFIYDPPLSLTPFPPISSEDRILVLAPHPDDEVLGAGGLLLEAKEKGAETLIVIATNGDGYSWAARFSRYKLLISSKDFVALGEKRMQESKAGIKKLGLSEEQLIFLGYPDRGLMPIWLEFWEQPFVSRYTKSYQPPYSGLYNYNNQDYLYAGQYLVTILRDLFLEFQPTIIVTPHPLDSHPDHWALTCFALYAGELAKSSGYRPDYIMGYLVHRGTWPHPRGYRPNLKLTPPRTLTNLGIEWFSLELSPEAKKLKARAIMAHRSQRLIMMGHLDSFIRKNELFSEVKAAFLPLNSPSKWIWHHPGSDTLMRRLLPSADISGVQLKWDGEKMHLVMHTFGKRAVPSKGEAVLAIPGGEESRPFTISLEQITNYGERVQYTGSINLKDLFQEDFNSVLLLCKTRLGWWDIDSTPPILVILENREE